MLVLDARLASSGYAAAESDLDERTIIRVLEVGTLITKRDNNLCVRRATTSTACGLSSSNWAS